MYCFRQVTLCRTLLDPEIVRKILNPTKRFAILISLIRKTTFVFSLIETDLAFSIKVATFSEIHLQSKCRANFGEDGGLCQ